MLNNLSRPAWMELNLSNLAHNFREVRRIVGDRAIICSVKADAYGHGAAEVSKVLENEGADALGVATVREAAILREGGIKLPIVCFSLIPDNLMEYVFEYDIVPVISSVESAKAINDISKNKYNDRVVSVMAAIDTGMGRIGFLPGDEAVDSLKTIYNLSNVRLKGLFSHFACSDDVNKEYSLEQLDKFNKFADRLESEGMAVSSKVIANSGACVAMPEAWLDGVRPGILLYGYLPSNDSEFERAVNDKIKLKQVMSIKAKIAHVKKVPKGTKISYGSTFVTDKESVIATVPVGYADGYLRCFSNNAEVIINHKKARVVGRVCMDQFMVDVTDIDDVKIGDMVILMGSDGDMNIDAVELAERAGTISYEIICGFGNRLEKIYT